MTHPSSDIKVGIGLLLPDATFNTVRKLEIEAAYISSNWQCLQQPPHITVKRPFNVKDNTILQSVIDELKNIMAVTEPFEVVYEGKGSFGNKVIHLQVSHNLVLQKLHRDLVEAMLKVDPESKQPAEMTHEMIFHTTLALNLTPAEFKLVNKHLDALPPSVLPKSVLIENAGIFMSNDGRHWNIVHKINLGKTPV